jgi:dephospho-CoA kinase
MKFNDLLREVTREILLEKQILYNNGARHGQVVFLAGGAGSGKGFAISNFMEGNKFRIIDVDQFKDLLLKINDAKGRYPELDGLDLSNPQDVSKLHRFADELGLKEKRILNLLKGRDKRRLPNLLFDVTLKRIGQIKEVLPDLKEVGYQDQNIHITWVLTDYHIAVQRNRDRDRIVPEDIVLKTHEGAANTMTDIVRNGTPSGVNGSVRVILGNPEHTVFFEDPEGQGDFETKPPSRDVYPEDPEDREEAFAGKRVVKDFKYITLKEAGKPYKRNTEVQAEVLNWIKQNIPKTSAAHDALTR